MDTKKQKIRSRARWGCRLLAALMLICLVSRGDAWCADIYVSNQGSDDYDGTIDRPLKSLAAAAARVVPGDRVLIAAGVYTQMLNITRSGTAEAPIIFAAMENADVLIDATGLRHGVIIWNAAHIVIQGLTVENAFGTGIHIHDHQGDDYGSDYNRIDGNTVRRCGDQGYNGIYVGGHYNQVVNNQVIDNGLVPDDPARCGHGIYVLGSHNLIRGNTVRGNARVGIRLEGEGNLFEANLIEDNQDFGLTVWVDAPMKGENIVIRDNTLRNNRRGGISLYGQGDGQKPDNITITGNNITDTAAEFGLRIVDGCRNIHVIGNTFGGLYRSAVLLVDETSLTGYVGYDNHFQAAGAICFGDVCYADAEAFKEACLADPKNLRTAP